MYIVNIKQNGSTKKIPFFDKLKAEAFASMSKTNLNTITISTKEAKPISRKNVKIVKG